MILKYWKFLHTDCNKHLEMVYETHEKRLKLAQDEAKFWEGKAREAQAMFDYQTKELEQQIEELKNNGNNHNMFNKMRSAEARERYHRKEADRLKSKVSKLEGAKVSTSADKKLSNGLKDHKNRQAVVAFTRKPGRPKGS